MNDTPALPAGQSGQLRPGRAGDSDKRGSAAPGPYPDRKRKVRLHPLPQEANAELAEFLGMILGGAIRSALHAHPMGLTRSQRGTLLGSIRKRAINQLVCEDGEARLREILGLNE